MNSNKPTLVVLAAGMGSRYGGLKQMDPVTEEGYTIIDFSLYDALKAGFGKFVFIIRESFADEFKAIFNKKLAGKAEVAYVYQETDAVPAQYINPNREKPWGTGHALLLTKSEIEGNFAIINGDDYYGQQAFEVMANALTQTDPESGNFHSIAYLLKNTVSDHGFVSRGECRVDPDGYLIDVTERTHIEKIDGALMRKDDEGRFVPIDENTVVSMNFWGFTPKCFERGDQMFEAFLKERGEELKSEFYLPEIVQGMLHAGNSQVKVLKSDAKWFGVTYKEDKPIVVEAIKELRKQGVYPKILW